MLTSGAARLLPWRRESEVCYVAVFLFFFMKGGRSGCMSDAMPGVAQPLSLYNLNFPYPLRVFTQTSLIFKTIMPGKFCLLPEMVYRPLEWSTPWWSRILEKCVVTPLQTACSKLVFVYLMNYSSLNTSKSSILECGQSISLFRNKKYMSLVKNGGPIVQATNRWNLMVIDKL